MGAVRPFPINQYSTVRKILFLAPNYPPAMTDGSSRAFRMASRLPAYGWEPIVIAPPAFVSDEDSFGTDAINEETAGVNGERIWRTGPPFWLKMLPHAGLPLWLMAGRCNQEGLWEK